MPGFSSTCIELATDDPTGSREAYVFVLLLDHFSGKVGKSTCQWRTLPLKLTTKATLSALINISCIKEHVHLCKVGPVPEYRALAHTNAITCPMLRALTSKAGEKRREGEKNPNQSAR
eukprot:3462937-Amphidinium_carterae.1